MIYVKPKMKYFFLIYFVNIFIDSLAFAPRPYASTIIDTHPAAPILRITVPVFAEKDSETSAVADTFEDSKDDKISLETVESLGKGAAKVCSIYSLISLII